MGKIIPMVDRNPFDRYFEHEPQLRQDAILVRINRQYEAMRSRYMEKLKLNSEDDDEAEDWLEGRTGTYNSKMYDLCTQFEDRLRELQLGSLID